jgi:hypothetical protein
MCLITEQKEPTILSEDMIVYKILTRHVFTHELVSPFRSFKWDLGKLYSTNITQKEIDLLSDAEFFDRDAKEPYYMLYSQLYEYSTGFHSFKTKDRARYYIVFECTIPAGSEIYEDKSGLIVSNQLIINKEA